MSMLYLWLSDLRVISSSWDFKGFNILFFKYTLNMYTLIITRCLWTNSNPVFLLIETYFYMKSKDILEVYSFYK